MNLSQHLVHCRNFFALAHDGSGSRNMIEGLFLAGGPNVVLKEEVDVLDGGGVEPQIKVGELGFD